MIDFIAFVGLLVFCFGLWLIYQPLAFVAFGAVIMFGCYKIARQPSRKGGK